MVKYCHVLEQIVKQVPEEAADKDSGIGEERHEGVDVVVHDTDPHHQRELSPAALDDAVAAVLGGEGDDDDAEHETGGGDDDRRHAQQVRGAEVRSLQPLAEAPIAVGPEAVLAVGLDAARGEDLVAVQLDAGVAAGLHDGEKKFSLL